MTKHIIFCGAFDIGETVSTAQLETIRAAAACAGDLAVVVGDIGVAEKLANYIRDGIDGVYEVYRRRISCATSGCVSSQLPRTSEFEIVIDEEAYEYMYQQLRQIAPHIVDTVRAIPFNIKSEEYRAIHSEYSQILREKIIPTQVQKRLQIYGIAEDKIRLYSERVMRNWVQKRIDKERKSNMLSWLHIFDAAEKKDSLLYLLLTEVLSSSGIPKCRGIMLALYENVALDGYEHITQLYSEKQYLAIKNAEELYEKLSRLLPNDARWQLTFHDRFYSS